MTTKHEVIAVHRAHPDWTASDIARHLGCVPQYVSATAKRNGLTLAKRPIRCRGPYIRKSVKIPAAALLAFEKPAQARGIEVHEIARLLLERIAADGIVNAVLDDEVAA